MSICIVCPDGHSFVVAADKIGGDVACPCCFTIFRADLLESPSSNARKEERRPRRSRDDDDDDDEDDEEDDEDEEEERPKRKAKAKPKPKAKRSRDEDEDDEGEDEDEEEVEWTKRKQQLSVCKIGVVLLEVSTYLMVFFAFLTAVAIDVALMTTLAGLAYFFFYFAAIPLIVLSVVAIIGSMFMNLAGPPKVEGRAAMIASLVFAFVALFMGLLAMLAYFGTLIDEAERAKRFGDLLSGLAVACFIICLFSVMGYLAKLMVFMRLHLEASQPVTYHGFIVVSFAIITGLVFMTPWLMENFDKENKWLGYVISLVTDVCAGFAIRMLLLHLFTLIRIRAAIVKYIKEA